MSYFLAGDYPLRSFIIVADNQSELNKTHYSFFISSKITFKPTAEIHLREAEIIVVSVINVAPGVKGTDSGPHPTSHGTLKGSNEGTAAARNALATQQQTAVPPVEEEVARIRLKISAKATYSK